MQALPQRPPTVEESLDRLIAIARESGAHALALDALRSSELLERARLYVAIVGDDIGRIVERAAGRPLAVDADDAVMLRDPRGICFTAGRLDAAWPANRRTDIVLADRAAVAHLRPTSRVRVRVVDGPQALDEAFALVDKLAIETGAVSVGPLEQQHVRHLCARLQYHLYEVQRALHATTEEMHARINTATIVRVVAETVRDQRARRPDLARERLASRLEVERTKFLMATKADAVSALATRIAAVTARDFRGASAALVREIATDALAAFWLRANGACIEPMLARLGKELVDELVASLGDLADALPLAAMAGLTGTRVRGFRRDEEGGAGVRLAHPLARRARVEAAACEELVSALEIGSRRLVGRLIADGDDARARIDERFGELIDGVLEAVRTGADIARETRAAGTLAEARERLSRLSADLRGLVVALERGATPSAESARP